MVELDNPHVTGWLMCFVCWITEATDTHKEYVIPIVFLSQQWLLEHTSVLHYMYIACFVNISFFFFFLLKTIFEKELMKAKEIAIRCLFSRS
jgi:hypothetical protein